MIRGLSVGEAALARAAFGTALRIETIRLLASPLPFDRAFVPGGALGRHWIIWPRRSLPADLSLAPVSLQATLIHELVHVWQAQTGINLLTGKVRAGDRPLAYAYPTGMDCDWAALNIEQQAMVVEHRFRLSRGGRVPADSAFYDRICPFGRETNLSLTA